MKNVYRQPLLCVMGLCAAVTAQSQTATIERVTVSGSDNGVVVTIDATRPVTPQAQILHGPDRIVVDLPGAVPAKRLRDIQLSGALRSVRTALFTANPPVTRVVLDLKMPQRYEISASGNKILVTVSLAQQVPSQTDEAEPK